MPFNQNIVPNILPAGDIEIQGSNLYIRDEKVTYAKMQKVSGGSKLLGSGSGYGVQAVREISLGSGLVMTGNVLSSTGGGSISLTTTGTSGAATLVGGVLNIPQYQGVLTNPITGTGTANEIAYFTGSTTLGSLSTATYPSLTELSYVKGVTSGIQTQLNGKEPTLTKGNLTESTSSVLTITGGSNAVIGSGTTIEVKQASGSQSGFLSSTDWTTFNSKQGALTLTTTGTSGAATLIGNTLNIPQYSGGGGGIATLNTLTAATQTFATGTTGSDFNISSSTSTHTFNIPDAGASARGLITTGTQTLAGSKTFSSAPIFSTMTAGSVLFAGAGGLLSQNNAQLFWNTTLNALGVGTNSVTGKIQSVAGTVSAAMPYAIYATATIPASAGQSFYPVFFDITAGATSSMAQYGMYSLLRDGYTGTNNAIAGVFQSNGQSTNTGIVVSGSINGNSGFYGLTPRTTSGNNYGATGLAYGGNISSGGVFRAGFSTSTNNKTGAKYVGVIGITRNDTGAGSTSTGGYFGLDTTTPTFSNAALICDNADAAYDIFLARDNGTIKWKIADGGDTTWAEGINMVFQTATGTKIGTATSQKIGFWNATPIVQPTTAVAAATLVGGGGTTITATDTFDGYTLQQVVKALRNSGLLA